MKLIVHPGEPLAGRVIPPGDKSITHRAFLLALIARGPTRVFGANSGADCASTLDCARALGLNAAYESGAWNLTPRPLTEPARVLDCGNSGTTMRLLPGVLAAQPFLSVLTGDESLSRRPVARVIEPLRLMGASLFARGGDRLPPLIVRGGALSPIRYALPVASAQVASCLLLAGLFANGESAVEIPGPARDHTERMLRAAGVPIDETPIAGGGRQVCVTGPARPEGGEIRLPGDFSAAAFFLAAAAARPGSRVTAEGVGLNPTRTGLLDVLEAMGARIERTCLREEMGEPVGDVSVTGPDRLQAFDVPPEWMPRLIDEAPAWAIAASAAPGISRLAGASELRIKESDRISSLSKNLSRLGIVTRERPDGLEVEGGVPRGGTVVSDGDHRIAMAFAALASRAASPVTIDDAASIATSYPGFAGALAALGARVETENERP
ncbi:MAG: 3-phosphoshikimate 1-carboxyvinyltransferase [Candidatus Eisenbacteria bacterium]|nr:3-phosphoshikimate 1-carboxyvinyltransferase [Candidatus Eisenbacteria bacterium]